MNVMLANEKHTVSRAIRIPYNFCPGHFNSPVSIQGVRKNAHFHVFQQRIRCPRFNGAYRKSLLPGKIEELHKCLGRVLPARVTWPDASCRSNHALL
jgi:hypothetical protein